MRRFRAFSKTLLTCFFAFAIALAMPLSAFAETSSTETSTTAESSDSGTDSDSGRVILIIAPYLTWSDITAEGTPNLYSIAADGAIGDLNTTSRNRETGEVASPLEAALTISAGYWAGNPISALAAYSSTERYEYGTAGEAFERLSGVSLDESKIVYLGMPVAESDNLERSENVVLGTLGQAVVDAGGTTAALGNSDVGYVDGEQKKIRPAALAAMDESGRVTFGDVSQDILMDDPDAPFGIRTDLGEFSIAFDEIIAESDEAGGPSLVVLDAGDSYRAQKFSSQVAESVAATYETEALSTLDTIVGYALAAKEAGDTVIVASCASFDSDSNEEMGPILVSGDASMTGTLTSSSTHQVGIVTAMDVTATILSSLGVDQPVTVGGSVMFTSDEEEGVVVSSEARIASLEDINTKVVSINSVKSPLLITYIASVLVLLAMALILLVMHHWRPTRKFQVVVNALRAALLALIAFPLGTVLMFLVTPVPSSSTVALASCLGVTLVVWVIGLVIWRFIGARVAMAILALAMTVTLLIDQWMGAPLVSTGFLSYSPLLAARFYGIGNEGAALLFGSSLVGFMLLLDEFPLTRLSKFMRKWGFIVFAFVCIMTMAAPFWGANVGVAVWGVVGYGFAWLLINGYKIGWKTVLAGFLLVVAFVAAFAAVDLLGGGEKTHLAQSLLSAKEGGLSQLVIIVTRKAAVNAKVLTHTNWSYVLIGVLVFLGIMTWRPSGDFGTVIKKNKAFGGAIKACLLGGFVAFFTEDSGIVIPALIFLYMGIGLVWLMVTKLNNDMFRSDFPRLFGFDPALDVIDPETKIDAVDDALTKGE